MLATLLLYCGMPQPVRQPDPLLIRIRQNMAENLAQLPNYTCRLNVERSARPQGTKRFGFLDRLRFEIAYVGGKELFAWPGADHFEDRSIFEMVRGTVGTGSFALHAHTLFTTSDATFEYKGETIEKGRKLLRWDYHVARERSRYLVTSVLDSGTGKGVFVGYRGTIWADSASMDVVRLEVSTDEIPAPVTIVRGTEQVLYARTRIGAREFLLPVASDLYTVDRAGLERCNHTTYDSCRQFAGESVVHFGEYDMSSVPASINSKRVLPALPPGLEVEVLLASRIDVTKCAIGDQLRARLLRAVNKGGAVILPKDAALTGRVCRIRKTTSGPHTLYLVGVQFDSIEYGDGRGPFRAVLESVSYPGWSRHYQAIPSGPDDLPGEGTFSVQAQESTEVTNLRMLWRTVELK